MRIVLIGCVKSSAYFLNTLISNAHCPVGVVTRAQSRMNSDFFDLSPVCAANGIPYIQVTDANAPYSANFIEQCRPDILYCFGWSQLLAPHIFQIPKLGTVGFHPAKLPNNRGRHPLIWALALGLSETASTFFQIDGQADTGGIISQEVIPISYTDDAASLYEKVLQTAGKQVLSFTEAFSNGTVGIQPQSEAGNSWRKRSVQDGKIDWRMSGRAIYNLVRALTKPYPGAHFEWGHEIVKVWKAEESPATGMENIECGKVISVQSPTNFYVKAYDSIIHVVDCDPVPLKKGDYLL